MKPSVGRIVHYIAFGTPGGEYKAGVHRAAIVTDVNDAGTIDLCIFNPTGLHFRDAVPQDEARDNAGTWHWPEKVDE